MKLWGFREIINTLETFPIKKCLVERSVGSADNLNISVES